MNILCKYLGGSHSYGLHTPQSDQDIRGIFCHTEPKFILGLNKFEHLNTQNESEDSCLYEIRNYFSLLKKGNTQAIEMLFNQNWISISPEFKVVQENKFKLIDSHKLFKCLEGYCHSELELALGTRTGKLGGKRKDSVDKFGFSPKNFVQLIRLSFCGNVFFKHGYFPLNIMQDFRSLGEILLDIKVNPGNYKKEELVEMSNIYREEMLKSYNGINYVYNFDEKLANELIHDIYRPFVK